MEKIKELYDRMVEKRDELFNDINTYRNRIIKWMKLKQSEDVDGLFEMIESHVTRHHDWAEIDRLTKQTSSSKGEYVHVMADKIIRDMEYYYTSYRKEYNGVLSLLSIIEQHMETQKQE